MGAGCGNREGRKAELMDWAGARLPPAQDLDLSSGVKPFPGLSGKPGKLGVEGVDRSEGVGVGYFSGQGKESEAELATCKQGGALQRINGKMGLPEHRLDIMTSNDPILLKSKVDVHRIGKTLPKVAQKQRRKGTQGSALEPKSHVT